MVALATAEDTLGDAVAVPQGTVPPSAVEVMLGWVMVTSTAVAADGGRGEGALRSVMAQFVAVSTLGKVRAVLARGEFYLLAKHVDALCKGALGHCTHQINEGNKNCGQFGGEVVQVNLPLQGHAERDGREDRVVLNLHDEVVGVPNGAQLVHSGDTPELCPGPACFGDEASTWEWGTEPQGEGEDNVRGYVPCDDEYEVACGGNVRAPAPANNFYGVLGLVSKGGVDLHD